MNCDYCFYKNESENRSVYSYGTMTLDFLEKIVAASLSQCSESCSFMFQGGEPTLATLSFFQNLVLFERKHNVNNVVISNSIQTNGYNLNEDWAKFFADENFLVGISLDGDEVIHNKFRKTHNAGTFDSVMKFIGYLKKYKVEFNVLCVVTAFSADKAERLYGFFKGQDFSYLQFIPCLDPISEHRGMEKFSLTPKLYAKFFKELFDVWYKDCTIHQGISVRNFDNYLLMLLGQSPENCSMNGRCSVNAVIEADGSVYPCDFYVMDEFFLGNMLESSFEELFSTSAAKSFVLSSLTVNPFCQRCRYFQLCRGGCRRDKVLGDCGSLNYYCKAVRDFLDYALPRLKEVSLMKEHPYFFMQN